MNNPSYSNPGGTGDRRALITVTQSSPGIFFFVGGLTLANIVDGNKATDEPNAVAFNAANLSNKWVTFDFGAGISKLITELKLWWQGTDAGVVSLVFQIQGSNDNSNWNNIGSTWNFSSSTNFTISLSYNSKGYRYYRLYVVSGTTTNTPDFWEVEFKIDDYVGGRVGGSGGGSSLGLFII